VFEDTVGFVSTKQLASTHHIAIQINSPPVEIDICSDSYQSPSFGPVIICAGLRWSLNKGSGTMCTW
jgi:hypothetical protein